jgi:hypothetical protein
MVFSVIEIVNGIFSMVFVLCSVLIGVKIILKYSPTNNPTFVYMGLTWIGLTSPWWGSTVSFVIGLFNDGQGISVNAYLLITITFIPIFILFYLKAITDLLWRQAQGLLIITYGIVGALFMIAYIYFSLVTPEVVGGLENPVDIRYNTFASYYLILIILTFLIGGIFFGKASLKSKNASVRFQGKLLIIAFCSFSIGAFLDASIKLDIIGLLITRSILISSALEFYTGFILPSFLQKRFLE